MEHSIRQISADKCPLASGELDVIIFSGIRHDVIQTGL